MNHWINRIRRKTVPAAFLTVLAAHGPVVRTQVLFSAISRDTIRIGERLEVHFKISYPKGSLVAPPLVQALSRNPFEPLAPLSVDTVSEADRSIMIFTLPLTSFDSGSFVIPSVPFRIFQGADTLTFWTDSFAVRVLTVPVDTTQAFRDIKGPLTPPWDWRDILPYLSGVVLAILAGLAAVVLWRRYRRKMPAPVPESVLTPAEKALQALQQIRVERLWLTADDKTYYSRLTDVLRLFFEEQFGFKAPEMVTGEIMDALRLRGEASDWLRKLEQVFRAADMAKFAKGRPSETEKEGALQTAEDYVRFVLTHSAPLSS